MTKKHFIALADCVRLKLSPALAAKLHDYPAACALAVVAETLADFCAAQNPRFDRTRWLAYVAGECGPKGGKR